jgi:hypothetical protein
MKEVNKKRILDIYNLIKTGYNPSQISKRLNISKQALNRFIKYLKDNSYIKKLGYGTWETSKPLTWHTSTQPSEIRGHAFIWKVRFNKLINWKQILEKNQINYDEVGIYNTPRILFQNKKIWFAKDIIIYFNKKDSFFAFNSIESKKLAVYRLLQLISDLSKYLNTPLNNFKFTSTREHYSLINNCLAQQCDKEGKSINVKNEEGYWFSIDNSLNLHEAEAIHPNTSQLDIIGIQKYFNEHKETQFKVTPKFILDTMNGIQQNQVLFSENIETHIKAIQDLGNAVNELTKIVKELKK